MGLRTSSVTAEGTALGVGLENSTCSVWMPASTMGTRVRGGEAL